MGVTRNQIIFEDNFTDVSPQEVGTGNRSACLIRSLSKVGSSLSLSDIASGSPTEFIRTFLGAYNDLYQRDMPIPPLQAMFRLMDQLPQTEVSIIKQFKPFEDRFGREHRILKYFTIEDL